MMNRGRPAANAIWWSGVCAKPCPENHIPFHFLHPQTSGNDVFYRNPYNVEENLFVNLSSPSSSQFPDVSALGSPEAAAKRLLAQTLEEFMSTRIGSRKEAEIVGFSQREAGGRLYYDVEVRGGAGARRGLLL